MPNLNLLIIEDEVLLAMDLAARLERLGHDVVGMGHSADEARAIIPEISFDLILLDIHLGDGADGITLAHELNQNYTKPIIFLTSSVDPVTVARARDCHPAAYMLKPFNERELAIALELAVSNFADRKIPPASNQKTIQHISSDSSTINNSLFLRKKDRHERVNFEDILWAEAQSNYTSVVTEQDSYMMASTLQEIEAQLEAPYFLRTHRSYVVNINKVNSISGNSLYIGQQAIPVSKSRKEMVFHHFRKL